MMRIGFITGCLLVLCGCIGIDRPEVQVTDVRLDGLTSGGARILVDLLVSNPNAEELPIPSVNLQVDVLGAGSFEFTDRPYAALPQNGVTTLTLAAAVRGASLAGKSYRVAGDVVFEPRGELRRVFYDNNVPLPRSSFSAEGVLE